ncbi:MAG TPA: hypothetical protein VGQ62_19205 [Chloroflexota bacterium]|jgi:hypothetical protein|nr:hypothetical protein [Chloroflexota bacterium]
MVRLIAIDWSGDRLLAHRRIWLAEAVEPGRLVRLEAGRDRAAIGDHLLRLSRTAHAPFVVGLDFGFSFPAWFMTQLGAREAPDLWAHVAAHGERWLAACAPPFWGRRGRPRPVCSDPPLRRCEAALPRVNGIAPKSMFQIGGAGAVGTGSLRGMPLLHALHAQGATIWPFTVGGWPVVVEIYPRLLTGPVRKSSGTARSTYLAERYPRLDAEHVRSAAASEDAFDAAVSALVMAEHAADLAALPAETDPIFSQEGRIWHPSQLPTPNSKLPT